ncbi:MAG: hypothetical protein LBV41_02980 [Cytophagaceae bacterium]|jgi:hypothetical protein|nr:hypothetical protein [Cytophagaceae bacterium]
MKTNQLQLVNFEQAKRLKVAGFDWECEYFFSENTKTFEPQLNHNYCGVHRDFNRGKKTECSAPSVALALKWFRDVKNCEILIASKKNEAVYIAQLGEEPYMNDKTFPTHEAAESALLDELLKMIEENNQ